MYLERSKCNCKAIFTRLCTIRPMKYQSLSKKSQQLPYVNRNNKYDKIQPFEIANILIAAEQVP